MPPDPKKVKRRRKEGEQKRQRRPAPPPPPPASLVNLLQKDRAVLKYFQSLQVNLDADVQVWKNRAVREKEENEKLRKELEKTKKRKATTKQASSRKTAKKKPTVASEKETTKPAKDTTPLEQGEPIDDSMLDALYDSDDSDGSSLAEMHHPHHPAVEQLDVKEAEQDRRDIFGFLQEAYDTLMSLGVTLVDVIQEEEEEEQAEEEEDKEGAFSFGGDDDDETTAQARHAPVRLSRRTDECVMIDIVDRIRNITLVPKVADQVSNNEESTILVDANHLVPCCNPLGGEQRDEIIPPFLQGKRLFFRALVILDTFCNPSLSHQQWDSYFTAAPGVDSMKLGLRGRQRMVDLFLQHLNREITDRWACADRSLYLATSALHYSKDATRDAESSALLGSAATSRSRLGRLVERTESSQLASALHLSRNNAKVAARTVLQYLVSATPSLVLEEYPKLPPVLSLVTLEGLMLISDPFLVMQPSETSDDGKDNSCSSAWFIRQLASWFSQDMELQLLLRSLALAVHVAASIWYGRLASSDERIHDVACVEIASYKRLLKSESWLRANSLQSSNKLDDFDLSQQLPGEVDWRDEARNLVNETLDVECWRSANDNGSDGSEAKRIILQIAMLVHGDICALESVVRESVQNVDESSAFQTIANLRDLLLVSSYGVRNTVLRQLDSYRLQIGSLKADSIQIVDLSGLTNLLLARSLELSVENRCHLLCIAAECAGVLADGNTAVRVIQHIIQTQQDSDQEEYDLSPAVTKIVFDTIRLTSMIPVVRVINLERRNDRMKAFLSQAFRERLLVVKAVTHYKEKERSDDLDLRVADGFEFGLNAIDGRGRLAEANSRLIEQMGSLSLVDKLVEPQWRPNDLKAFDRDAPDVETLVRMSPSERACALSHICSWKGVSRSLKIPQTPTNASSLLDMTKPKLLRYPNHLLRLYKISGFAEGPALLSKNDNMPPAPVCVILEDDAILVDHFAERLADLLKELPRDFHFCSLGYSRPKSAPIVPYSSKIGIPSMLWYLTGYCLSEAGANYLLDSLPVVGPVDSWIGLKMTNNWDNSFGMALGVGVHAKPNSELPAHKDLCKILQFRAYCALQPLCTQKVRVAVAAATAGTVVAAQTGRNWRQRDTDIEYSGDIAKTGMAHRR